PLSSYSNTCSLQIIIIHSSYLRRRRRHHIFIILLPSIFSTHSFLHKTHGIPRKSVANLESFREEQYKLSIQYILCTSFSRLNTRSSHAASGTSNLNYNSTTPSENLSAHISTSSKISSP